MNRVGERMFPTTENTDDTDFLSFSFSRVFRC